MSWTARAEPDQLSIYQVDQRGAQEAVGSSGLATLLSHSGHCMASRSLAAWLLRWGPPKRTHGPVVARSAVAAGCGPLRPIHWHVQASLAVAASCIRLHVLMVTPFQARPAALAPWPSTPWHPHWGPRSARQQEPPLPSCPPLRTPEWSVVDSSRQNSTVSHATSSHILGAGSIMRATASSPAGTAVL